MIGKYFMQFRNSWLAGPLLGLVVSLKSVFALDLTRAGEIKECAVGEISTWTDGADKAVPYASLNFLYNPTGAPPWFSENLVAELIQRASNKWSECGISAQSSIGDQPHYLMNNEVFISWNDIKSQGNIGASDLSQRRLYLSPSVFKNLREMRPSYDASYTLQMTLSHEMGHFYGLVAHSRRCVDVLSYYKNNSGELCNIRDRAEFARVIEYRSALPTACDIERCRRINR